MNIQFYFKKTRKRITITTKLYVYITTTTITIKMPTNFNEPTCINYYKVHKLASPSFDNEKEASIRSRIHSAFKNLYSGERIQKVADLFARFTG